MALVLLVLPVNAHGLLVAVGGGQAFGAPGVILSSPDGLNWTQRASPLDDMEAVASDGTQWLAVGTIHAGPDGPSIYASQDGLEWSPQPFVSLNGPPGGLNGIVYEGGLWIAVGNRGTIIVSLDRTRWDMRPTGMQSHLMDIATDGEAWVAVGTAGAILTSDDGLSWSAATSGTAQDLLAVAYGGSEWLAVGTEGTILTSRDRVLWYPQTLTAASLRGIAYSGDTWIVVGEEGAVARRVGSNWTLAHLETTPTLHALAHCGLWSAVGDDGKILTSPDGLNWKRAISPTPHALLGISSNRRDCPKPAEVPSAPPTSSPSKPEAEPPAPAAPPETVPAAPNATVLPLPARASNITEDVVPPIEALIPPIRHEPSAPSLIIGPIVAASAVGILAGLALSKLLLPLGLFSRLRTDKLLDNPVRAQLFELVKSNPGIHFREIVRRIDRQVGVVYHHLAVLTQGHLLRSDASVTGGHRRYFAVDISDPRVLKAVSALWNPGARKIMFRVLHDPGTTLAAVAEATGLEYGIVQAHAKRLRNAGLLLAHREQRTLHLVASSLAGRVIGSSFRDAPTPKTETLVSAEVAAWRSSSSSLAPRRASA